MNPKRKRERFLTDAEFTRLGQVLDEVSGKGSRISAGAIATIRLLMLTGCRRNEILTLRWEHVDLDKAEMRIVDGKTGARTVHLSPSAVRVLTDLPRKPGNPWVIPGAKPGRHMTDIDAAWASIRAQAGLRDVRIHDIRHLRLAGACARRGPADHRPAARSPPGRDDRALCAPCARLGEGIRRADRRQHRRRYPVGALIPVTLATFMLLSSGSRSDPARDRQSSAIPRFLAPAAETGAVARHRAQSGRIQTPDHGWLSMASSSDFGAFPATYLSRFQTAEIHDTRSTAFSCALKSINVLLLWYFPVFMLHP